MTTLSQDIRISFSNILKVYEDISTLLQDADALMEKAGYQCLHGNYVGTESSKHIGSPRYWVYPYICRYYTTEEHPAVIKAIGAVFIDPNQSATVPVIVTGTFKSTGNPKSDNKYNYSYLRESWFKIAGEREFNHPYQVKGLNNVETGVIQVFPIEAVSDLETLKAHLIQPLLAMHHRLDREG